MPSKSILISLELVIINWQHWNRPVWCMMYGVIKWSSHIVVWSEDKFFFAGAYLVPLFAWVSYSLGIRRRHSGGYIHLEIRSLSTVLMQLVTIMGITCGCWPFPECEVGWINHSAWLIIEEVATKATLNWSGVALVTDCSGKLVEGKTIMLTPLAKEEWEIDTADRSVNCPASGYHLFVSYILVGRDVEYYDLPSTTG